MTFATSQNFHCVASPPVHLLAFEALGLGSKWGNAMRKRSRGARLRVVAAHERTVKEVLQSRLMECGQSFSRSIAFEPSLEDLEIMETALADMREDFSRYRALVVLGQ